MTAKLVEAHAPRFLIFMMVILQVHFLLAVRLAMVGRIPDRTVECAGTQSCRALISRISSTVITKGGVQVGSIQA